MKGAEKMVKEVAEIPTSGNVRVSNYRQMIRDDIQYAIDNGINKFEFEGDYNYKYLKQYAQEVANKIMSLKINKLYREYKEQELTEQEKTGKGFYLSLKSGWEFRPRFINVTSIKGEERRRVFCEIDLSELENRVKKEFDNSLANARSTHTWNGTKWVWNGR